MSADLTAARGPRSAFGRAVAAALVVTGLAAWAARPAPEQGWLGVTLGDATGEHGPAARLEAIVPESPAVHIGLAAGDLVRTAGRRRIGSARDLARAVRRRAPGTLLPLTVERGGVPLALAAPLAARPPDVYRLLEVDRDPWQEPERILDLLGARAGAAVADLGAGGGYFAERLAARVGPAGRVVAIDVDEDALAQLRTRFPPARFPQVAIRRGTARDPGIEPDSLDAVLMVDTYHELTEPAAILAAVRRSLRSGGRLVVVDRPAAEYRTAAHAISESRVVEQAGAAGFHQRERHDLARQFALVFQ